MEQRRYPDFMELYHEWDKLPPGPKAELRRIAKPDKLIEVSAFYRLFSGKAQTDWEKDKFQRLIFCLPHIEHIDEEVGLGKALAKGQRVNEKRLFQVVRSESPNDIIQLRRILGMFKPRISTNWPLTAKLLWDWTDWSKRKLLEDFFSQPTEITISIQRKE
jgi:CRISPR system Cascade subunit CasB